MYIQYTYINIYIYTYTCMYVCVSNILIHIHDMNNIHTHIYVQEWPSGGSRRAVFKDALARRGCAVLEGEESVAIAYSTSMTCQNLTPMMKDKVNNIIAEIILQGLDPADAKGLRYQRMPMSIYIYI